MKEYLILEVNQKEYLVGSYANLQTHEKTVLINRWKKKASEETGVKFSEIKAFLIPERYYYMKRENQLPDYKELIGGKENV